MYVSLTSRMAMLPWMFFRVSLSIIYNRWQRGLTVVFTANGRESVIKLTA